MTIVGSVIVAAGSPLVSARVAAWTRSEARRLGARLRDQGIEAVDAISRPPAAATRHRSVVSAVLRLSGATCLVRSAVLQRWDSHHDRARPLVLGVTRLGDGGFAAHAWLEGDDDGDGFVELHRRHPG